MESAIEIPTTKTVGELKLENVSGRYGALELNRWAQATHIERNSKWTKSKDHDWPTKTDASFEHKKLLTATAAEFARNPPVDEFILELHLQSCLEKARAELEGFRKQRILHPDEICAHVFPSIEYERAQIRAALIGSLNFGGQYTKISDFNLKTSIGRFFDNALIEKRRRGSNASSDFSAKGVVSAAEKQAYLAQQAEAELAQIDALAGVALLHISNEEIEQRIRECQPATGTPMRAAEFQEGITRREGHVHALAEQCREIQNTPGRIVDGMDVWILNLAYLFMMNGFSKSPCDQLGRSINSKKWFEIFKSDKLLKAFPRLGVANDLVSTEQTFDPTDEERIDQFYISTAPRV